MCTKCSNAIGRKSKSKKMATIKRRRSRVSGLNTKDVAGVATSAVLGGAGAVILGMVLDKVVPPEYQQYNHYIKIAAGIGLSAMSKNTYVQAAGLGAATVGTAALVADLTDGVNGMGLLPPGRQTYGIRARPEYRIAGNGDQIVMQ